MEVKQTRDTLSATYFQAIKIRNQVFVKEQGIPTHLEIDDQEAHSLHFVLFLDTDTAVATTRLLLTSDTTALIQRVAVLADYRKQGLAKSLLKHVINFAKQQGLQRLTLHAQLDAIGLYEALGFQKEGEILQEAGLPHQTMILDL